jgi:hypothetical protein
MSLTYNLSEFYRDCHLILIEIVFPINLFRARCKLSSEYN